MTIITPISYEYKKLLKDDYKGSNLKDFYSNYINLILSEKQRNSLNKKFITKKDFELFEGYLENLKEYKEILNNKFVDINSLSIIEILIGGQTKNEFKDFIKNNTLISYHNDNIVFLFGEDFFNIKNHDDLLKIINNDNWKNIIKSLGILKKENIKFIFGKNKIIKNIDDLLKLISNKNWEYINDLLENWDRKNIELLFGKDLLNIKNTDDLLELFNKSNYNIPHLKAILKNNDVNSNDIKSLRKMIKLKKNPYNIYKIKIEDNNNIVNSCGDNEVNNNEILLGDNNNYLTIYIKNKIIGIVKKEGENSFLSFENVLDTKGNILFMKGFIYNIEIDGEKISDTIYINHKKIDFSQIKGNISRNPIRKIKEFHNKELYKSFDEIIKNFKDNLYKNIEK